MGSEMCIRDRSIKGLNQFRNVYFAFPAPSKTLVDIGVRIRSDGSQTVGRGYKVMVPAELSASQLKCYLRFVFKIFHSKVRLRTQMDYRKLHATFSSLLDVLDYIKNPPGDQRYSNTPGFVFSEYK